MKEAIYINAYAPGEGNFGFLMNNDLGSHIDPIWKAISSVIQDSVKRKDVYSPLHYYCLFALAFPLSLSLF